MVDRARGILDETQTEASLVNLFFSLLTSNEILYSFTKYFTIIHVHVTSRGHPGR